MEKIKKIAITNMRQQQAFEFINKVCYYTDNPFPHPFNKYHEELVKANKEFDEALCLIRQSRYTEYIQEYDRKRKQKWLALRTFINSALLRSDELLVNTAKDVHIILNTYRNPVQRPYTEQIGMIKNIITDLRGKIKEDARKKLGVEALIIELEEANDRFDTFLSSRSVERSEREPGLSQVSRKKVEKAYRNLTEALHVFVASEDEDNEFDFKVTIRMINQLIDEEKAVMKARATRLANQKKGKKKIEEAKESANTKETEQTAEPLHTEVKTE